MWLCSIPLPVAAVLLCALLGATSAVDWSMAASTTSCTTTCGTGNCNVASMKAVTTNAIFNYALSVAVGSSKTNLLNC